MYFRLAILTLVATVKASPWAMPQGVTAIITPSGSGAPAGCTPSTSGSFAIAIQALISAAPARRHIRRAPEPVPAVMMGRVSQIRDGQVQAGMHTMVVTPIAQISDGQPQAPTTTAAPVSQITDGQPQAPTATAAPVSQITDSQPQAPTGTIFTAGPEPTQRGAAMVACNNPNTLNLTLNNGVLQDSHGRAGYIASNYQFQFDGPPQAGALITAGFSVCGNGSLALGGTNIFYQCLSGDFYNIYNTEWAPQCEPVIINTLKLINCFSAP